MDTASTALRMVDRPTFPTFSYHWEERRFVDPVSWVIDFKVLLAFNVAGTTTRYVHNHTRQLVR